MYSLLVKIANQLIKTKISAVTQKRRTIQYTDATLTIGHILENLHPQRQYKILTHTQDNGHTMHQYMTSLPKNAYNERLLHNVKGILMTNHHHVTAYRHLLTTMQDVIIVSIITAEII